MRSNLFAGIVTALLAGPVNADISVSIIIALQDAAVTTVFYGCVRETLYP